MDNAKYLSRIHSINYLQVGLFCPAALATKDRYTFFTNSLTSFEDDSDIYKKSINNYAAYLVFKVIKNSFHTSDSILTYENYFYKTCTGYYLSINKEVDASLIAKYWLMLLNIYNSILTINNGKEVKNLIYNDRIYLKYPHINSNVKNFSYYIENLLQLEFVDGTFGIINIVPEFPGGINLLITALSEYYKHTLNVIYLFKLSLNSPKSTFSSIYMSEIKLKQFTNIYSKLVVNFNLSNISNCLLCPRQDICSDQYKIYNIDPNLIYIKTNRILLLNKDKD